jgi:phage FluMu protein Com
MDPLHATIEEFAAEGFTHVQCYCPQCRVIRLRPISWLPRISLGLTIAQLSAQLRCAKCGGPLHSVKPGDWKMCSTSHSGVEADLLYEAPTNIC